MESAGSTWVAFAPAAQSVPPPGNSSPRIDLHAQRSGPVFYYYYPYPQFHTLYTAKRSPADLLIRLAISPHAQVTERGRQMCINQAACQGLGAYQFGFLVQSRRDMCGDEWRRRLLRSSLLFLLVRRLYWPLSVILCTDHSN